MCSSTLSLISALDKVGGQRHAPAALPSGKRSGTHCTWGWVGPMAVLNGCGNLALSRIRSTDLPAPYSNWAIPAPISSVRSSRSVFNSRASIVRSSRTIFNSHASSVRRSGRGPEARLCCICFVFLARIITCGLYKLTLPDQAQVTHFFRFSVKIFSRSVLAR